MNLWTNDYLRETLKDVDVTVASIFNSSYYDYDLLNLFHFILVTPNGRADAVVDNYFVKPAEKNMLFPKFLDLIEAKVCFINIFR